ncbi:MAG TPA: phosphoglucosamine mutase [Micromonospora sp.]|nr:phosphoglucosamine mutase [Micromonospora sp.]
MGRIFGTDGVRGRANDDLTPELALAVAVAAAQTLAEAERSNAPLAVVGRDPRASGEMLEAAVVAGLTSAGANVVRLGVLPTPGVAHLVGEAKADFGVMISASHNPMPDNGIKLFAAGGHKLPDEIEMQIEAAVAGTDDVLRRPRPVGARVGRVQEFPDGADRYLHHLVGSVPHRLAGVRVVVDCAHGAAAKVAPETYRAAGAEVIAINAEPDGLNINDGCGSTCLDVLKAAVVEQRADLGIALDGDADRCLAVTAEGDEVDGDQIMAILALAMREADVLTQDTLVATVMSNLGLRITMANAGIRMIETKVGDRYVLEELRASGLALGGEQSGHIVMPTYSTTGDGVLTGLHLMARIAATGQSLAELASVMTKLPQVLINVPVADRTVGAGAPAVLAAGERAQAELGSQGRILLRPSGTEPLVRVMVEAATLETAQLVAERIADEVRAASPVAGGHPAA